MPNRRFPSEAGLAVAIERLAAIPAARVAAHFPVLLAIESALAAGESTNVDVGGAVLEVVSNAQLESRLRSWFGVEGQEGFPYFSPITLPGGRESSHWRFRGIISQNTMSAAKHRGWVAGAVRVDGGRGYPLADLSTWRTEVAASLGDPDKPDGGIDLALLGIWLIRTEGIECEGEVPTRDELVARALGLLGISDTSPLLRGDPALLSESGEYDPEPEHFDAAPLGEEAIRRIAVELEGSPDAETGADDTDELVPSESWLRDRFEEWQRETSYPSPEDERQKAVRVELASSVLPESDLAAGDIDVPAFRRLAARNYGSPGPQSAVLGFLRDNPDTGPARLAKTIHHLLYGAGDDEDRLREVVEDPDWKIPGFGESLATKCLAVRFPERWLPLFVYRSGQGVGKRDFLRIIKEPALEEQGKHLGQLAAESNDRLRARTEPLLPDDPWGQLSFLWWLRGWAPSASLAEELLLSQEWIDEVEALVGVATCSGPGVDA